MSRPAEPRPGRPHPGRPSAAERFSPEPTSAGPHPSGPSSAEPSSAGPSVDRPRPDRPEAEGLAIEGLATKGPATEGRSLDVVAYYRRPEKAALLRCAVVPLAERCAAQGLAVHVDRHWLYGPHLRVRLHGPAPAVEAAARQGAADVQDWVRAHPSGDATDEAELLAQAAAAGRAELIAPPYGPLVPDDTVRVEPVDPAPLRALLGADGAALRDDLMALGVPALGSSARYLGERGDGATARLRIAVTALAAHAANHPGGLVGGHYSYVSHLEDFLVHDDPDGRLHRAFEEHRRCAGAAVTELVGRVAEGGAEGWERDWARWSAAAWRLAEGRLAAGADLTAHAEEYRARAAATGDPAAARRWGREQRAVLSDFHRLLTRADPHGAMWTRPDYLLYRACTNALYRLLAVCDVRPVERYLAAHLVVSAVPALTGHSWHAALTEAARAADAEGRAS